MTEETTEGLSFEIKCGVLIAIFAAIMAVGDMFAGKYGEDEIKYINEKANAYLWYQAKSIRETNIEGQRDLIETMTEGKDETDPVVMKLKTHTEKLNKKLARYAKEKKEILVGSSKLTEAEWAQEVDGKLGQVIGAKEYEEKIEILGRAGDQFDFSNLFFQLCLVMGAISLVVKKEELQKTFFYVMATLGTIGTVFAVYAYNIASVT